MKKSVDKFAFFDKFLSKCSGKDLSIGIIGLGHVGLPLATAFLSRGIKVIGYDINKSRVKMLNSGHSGVSHVKKLEFATQIADGSFKVVDTPEHLSTVDAILIAVPTPIDGKNQPDLSHIKNTCQEISQNLKVGQLIVLESTTYPGTTTNIVVPILEQSGLKANMDFAVGYSPERVDPGNSDYGITTTPKVIGADHSCSLEMMDSLYSIITRTVTVTDTRTAEATKLLENIYRWVNIATVNEMKSILRTLDIDIWEVIKAAESKPFGFQAFYPGPGVGGHCIGVDPYFLSYIAGESGLNSEFIDLAGKINTNMPRKIVEQLTHEAEVRLGKDVSNLKVLICGISYKKNVGDMRESPSLVLMDMISELKADVQFYDPFIPTIPNSRKYPKFNGVKSVHFEKDILSEFDIALIATDHSNVDYELLCEMVPLVLDSRNATRDIFSAYSNQIVKV